jgi:hypothetical protein
VHGSPKKPTPRVRSLVSSRFLRHESAFSITFTWSSNQDRKGEAPITKAGVSSVIAVCKGHDWHRVF